MKSSKEEVIHLESEHQIAEYKRLTWELHYQVAKWEITSTECAKECAKVLHEFNQIMLKIRRF